MLFYCVWPDESSLLVDVADEHQARAAATGEHEHHSPPSAVASLGGVFGARVNFHDDGTITIDPLAHVFPLLDALEDKLTPSDDEPLCGAEADDDAGRTVTCEEPALHTDDHRCGTLIWPNERAPGSVASSRG